MRIVFCLLTVFLRLNDNLLGLSDPYVYCYIVLLLSTSTLLKNVVLSIFVDGFNMLLCHLEVMTTLAYAIDSALTS